MRRRASPNAPLPVREALLAGLENWWLAARGRDAAAHDWLGAVLQIADADGWRAQVRAAVDRRDRRRLEELAGKNDVARQPKAAVTSLSRALLDVQAYDAAVALLRPAQQRFPDDIWINLDLGAALVRRQPPDYTEALRFFSIARVLRPEAPLYVNIGTLLMGQSDWDGVIFVSRRALELQPEDSAKAYTNLGVGLERKGDWEQARSAYEKAVELKPDLAQAHYHLGKYLDGRGQRDQAVAELERAVQLAPGDFGASLRAGKSPASPEGLGRRAGGVR